MSTPKPPRTRYSGAEDATLRALYPRGSRADLLAETLGGGR
jgi:hypothetical protein